MPPVFMPTLFKLAAGTAAGAAVVHWVVREARRINEELDRLRATPSKEPVAREALPTLRRDPITGDWRVMG